MGGRLVQLALMTALAAAGCSGESLGGSAMTGFGGAASGGQGGDVFGGAGSSGEGVCSQRQNVRLDPLAADVLILMDRASSMNDDSNGMSCTGGCGATSKWSLLSAAVNGLVAAYPQINWGLALYGSDDLCDTGVSANVGVGPGTAGAISAALAAATLGGEAPTADAITNALADVQTVFDNRLKYILLVSDGRSGCEGDAGTADAATAIGLTWTEDEVPTFVLGPPPGADTAATAALDQMAQTGGEGAAAGGGASHTPADIGPALLPIASCVLRLPERPAGVTDMAVALTLTDGSLTEVPEDATNGWTYTNPSMTAIVLRGTSCTTLTDGAPATVFYACGNPIIDIKSRSR